MRDNDSRRPLLARIRDRLADQAAVADDVAPPADVAAVTKPPAVREPQRASRRAGGYDPFAGWAPGQRRTATSAGHVELPRSQREQPQ